MALFAPSVRADSIPLAKLEVLRYLAEGNQIAVIAIDENGLVDVHLFVSLVDRSGKSNTVKLVLPFVDEPLDFKVAEMTLSNFTQQHTEPLRARIRNISLTFAQAIQQINDGWMVSTIAGAPLGVLFALVTRTARLLQEAAPGLAPKAVIVTEHTRTEIYHIERPKDVDALLQGLDLPTEKLERLKHHLVGRYLYLVTIQTIPIPKSALTEHPSRRETRAFPSTETKVDLGVDFHVRLKARRNSKAWTFTYPLGTGETWWHPIPLTEVFVTAPSTSHLHLSYPILPDAKRIIFYPRGDEKAQDFFVRRDRQGHLARIAYWNANPSEDIIITLDPTRRPKGFDVETIKWIANGSWVIFLLVFAITWLASTMLFANAFIPEGQSKLVWADMLELVGIGVLWAIGNALVIGVLLSPAILWFWLRYKGTKATYLHCLGFYILYGSAFAILSVLLRDGLYGFLGI